MLNLIHPIKIKIRMSSIFANKSKIQTNCSQISYRIYSNGSHRCKVKIKSMESIKINKWASNLVASLI